MFHEPLVDKNATSMAGHLVALHDACSEFHHCCAFISHANSLIAKQPAELDEEVAEGLSLCNQALRLRSREVLMRIRDLYLLAHAEEAKRQ